MRLSSRTETKDALEAMAARRRELPLRLVSDRPLRKPSGRTQTLHMGLLRQELLVQVEEQMSQQNRRAFRGRVAVDLSLALPSGYENTGLKTLAKAYLDVLGESAFFDDAKVEHIIVSRAVSSGEKAEIAATCLPVAVFAASFDRSFRVAPELALTDPDQHRTTRPWGLHGFDSHDEEILAYEEGILRRIEEIDAAEQEALEEDEDASFFPDLSESDRELGDPQLRESLGPELSQSVSLAIGRKLTDQGFDSRDRPGPPPGWLEEVFANDLGDVEKLSAEHPGCFTLPAPPQSKRAAGAPSWTHEVMKAFASRFGSPWRWGWATFGEPLALDIAIRGGAAASNDLDNLAHQVIASFANVFKIGKPAFAGYRAYRVSRGTPELRVRVIPAIRLQLLRRSIDQAHDLILAERRERSRS